MFGKKTEETPNCCPTGSTPASTGCGCGSHTQTNKPSKEKQEQNRCC